MRREPSSGVRRLAAVGLVFCVLGLSPSCGRASTDTYPAFGFSACFDLPQTRPNDWCGTDNGGPTSRDWMEGPLAGFDKANPSQIAVESLQWFEHSSESAQWRENSTARLVLTYPSGSQHVMACFTPGLDLTWENQLRNWFERFPPSGEKYSRLAAEGYHWIVEFGDRGRLRGDANSDSAALKAMRLALEGHAPSRIFDDASFTLGFTKWRSSNAMDCYFVDVDSLEQIDDLPHRLREKREANGGS